MNRLPIDLIIFIAHYELEIDPAVSKKCHLSCFASIESNCRVSVVEMIRPLAGNDI